VRLEETVTITPPSTGRPTITKQSFTVVEQGKIPQPLSSHPQTDFPTLWRGVQAGGSDRGDFMNDTIGKLPVCGYDQSLPSTLPGMYMPQSVTPHHVRPLLMRSQSRRPSSCVAQAGIRDLLFGIWQEWLRSPDARTWSRWSASDETQPGHNCPAGE
jgi:hypothetical protein